MKGSRLKMPNKFKVKSQVNSNMQSLLPTARENSIEAEVRQNRNQILKTTRDVIIDQDKAQSKSDANNNSLRVNDANNLIKMQRNANLLGGKVSGTDLNPSMPSARGDMSSKLNSSKNISNRMNNRNVTLSGGSFSIPPQIKILTQPLSATNRNP
jgi:hypothetical protein